MTLNVFALEWRYTLLDDALTLGADAVIMWLTSRSSGVRFVNVRLAFNLLG